MAQYEVLGQSINTVEMGSPNRQKAILIHGWSSSSYALQPLMELLSKRYHVIAIDLPGYGKSEDLKERVTIKRYADIVAELIRQISNGPVILVGHSMGGMTSLTAAIHTPELIERIVCISPTITGVLSSTTNLLIAPINFVESTRIGGAIIYGGEMVIGGITDRMMRGISFADRTKITDDEYHVLRADARQRRGGRTRAECFTAMRNNNLSGKLSSIQTPILFIWGAEDNTVPLRDAGVVAEEMYDADLRILPNAGHWPQFEAKQIVQKFVASFLGVPVLTDNLNEPVGDAELAKVRETAQFLGVSSIGENLNDNERFRLASQLNQYVFPPFRSIYQDNPDDPELFVVQAGTIEAWTNTNGVGRNQQPQRLSELRPGDMTGELAMIDHKNPIAELISGAEGAVILGLNQTRLLALVEDDPELGTKLMWNLTNNITKLTRQTFEQLEKAGARSRLELEVFKQERLRK